MRGRWMQTAQVLPRTRSHQTGNSTSRKFYSCGHVRIKLGYQLKFCPGYGSARRKTPLTAKLTSLLITSMNCGTIIYSIEHLTKTPLPVVSSIHSFMCLSSGGVSKCICASHERHVSISTSTFGSLHFVGVRTCVGLWVCVSNSVMYYRYPRTASEDTPTVCNFSGKTYWFSARDTQPKDISTGRGNGFLHPMKQGSSCTTIPNVFCKDVGGKRKYCGFVAPCTSSKCDTSAAVGVEGGINIINGKGQIEWLPAH